MACTKSGRAWQIPVLAALVVTGVLAYQALTRGPELCITFTTGEGLQVGKTRLRYRSVEVGRLEATRLSSDRTHVTAVVRLTGNAARLASCGTRFWVVRPRVDGASVSDIGTLVSGPYIAAEMSRSTKACRNFIGLETPPVVSSSLDGTRFELRAASPGSLEAGSPVYFRRVQVGRVLGYTLGKNGDEVGIEVFVKAPFARYVTASSHWWRASAFDVRLNANGLRVDTSSLATILNGGVQFDSPDDTSKKAIANEGTRFPLGDSQSDAIALTQGFAAPVSLRFHESLRGLAVGAPVDFRGVELGEVVRIDVDRDLARGVFDMVATVNLYPDRLGRRYREALGQGDSSGGRALLRAMIEQGLRGQLRMGNALTGQRYIALDFFPHAPAVRFDVEHEPVELPTVPNAIEELQDQLSSIVTKLDRVPFDRIGNNLQASLKNADTLFKSVNDQIVPQAQSTLGAAQQSFAAARATLQQDSPLQSDVHLALAQLKRTLASIDSLADYLERHPESLLWGK
ncbi:MAG TPA: MlaD family protein [Paraburkholderia sp.]|jgi:paraquat-inducible protein B|uniref:PqiB family protein n=1 Tax=Paraburkholderia sp. TaxID=1926495 RepID=UPI002DF64F2F|nr:MlaD family protein [Paraburkholderia sp.]